MARKLTTKAITDDAITADKIVAGAVVADIGAGTVTPTHLHSTLDLSTKTVTLPSLANLEVSAGAPTVTLNSPGQVTNKKIVRIAASQYTAGDFSIQQMNDDGTTVGGTPLLVNGAGNIGVGTTSVTKAQLSVYSSEATKPAILLSQLDGGENAFSIRSNRYLTSNGTNWITDGQDPIGVVSTNSTSTAKFPSNGLVMHNDQTTANAFSPPIMFGAQSNSTSYNSTYGYIAGRKIGQGVDANWNTGEVWIDTAGTKHNGNNGYMDDVPAIKVRTTGTVDMPWQACSFGTFTGAIPSNLSGFQFSPVVTQGLNYNSHSTHGNGLTVNEEGYYACFATGLYDPSNNSHVYIGWAINGNMQHHWHSNHSITSNHDFVSHIIRYMNVGDHLTIEHAYQGVTYNWGGAHSAYSVWKVG